MKKSMKFIRAIGLTAMLVSGVILVQFAGAGKNAETERYKEMLKVFFSSGQIAYDYHASFDTEDSAGLVSSGRMIRSGQDYIDSNAQYYRILAGNTFLNVDLGMKSVFLVDIAAIEAKMGFVRADLNNTLFNVTDSNYAGLGTWHMIAPQKNDSLVGVVFTVSDTTGQPVSKVEFLFKGTEVHTMNVHFSNAGQVSEGVTNMMVRMTNFSAGHTDLSEKIAAVISMDGPGGPLLADRFRDFKLRRL